MSTLTPSSAPAEFVETSSQEFQAAKRLQLQLEGEALFGVNPFRAWPENGVVTEQMFRRIAVEVPKKEPTIDQFRFILTMGAACGNAETAKDVLRVYAFDEHYPHRALALSVLASVDPLAKLLLEKLTPRAPVIREITQTVKNQPVVCECCSGGRH